MGAASMEAPLGLTDSLLDGNPTTQPDTTFPAQNTTNNTGCLELSGARINPCDNSDGLVSMATQQLVYDLVYIGVVPLLTVLGVATNVINMAVFVAQGLGDRVHLCLFSLSLADLLALTTVTVRYLRNFLAYVISPSWATEVWLANLIRYRLTSIHAGFLVVTNFISTIIAVDRWICVTWPLQAARVLSTRKTCVVVVVFSVIFLAGNQLAAFKYDAVCAYVKGAESITFLYILPSTLYRRHPVLMETVDSFGFSSMVPTLSILITATATALTAVRIRRAALWRDSSARGGGSDVINRKEKSLTSMLVVISCVFVICVSPRVVSAWCRFFIPEYRAWGKRCGLLLVTQALMNALLAANSTVNFFVYYTMGSRFRTTLSQLIHRCSCTPPEK